MTIKAENTSVGLAALLLDGLGVKGAQKRGSALALVDLMRSVVREEMAGAQRKDSERALADAQQFVMMNSDLRARLRGGEAPPPDVSLALPLTQGASDSALAKLANEARASGEALHGFADQAVHDIEVDLSATPRWRWLKRRTLTRQLSKARYQYAVAQHDLLGARARELS